MSFNTIFKTCTNCKERKAIDCCFGDITLSWCKNCRARQQNEREISKRPKFENHLLTITKLESQLKQKDTTIKKLEGELDVACHSLFQHRDNLATKCLPENPDSRVVAFGENYTGRLALETLERMPIAVKRRKTRYLESIEAIKEGME